MQVLKIVVPLLLFIMLAACQAAGGDATSPDSQAPGLNETPFAPADTTPPPATQAYCKNGGVVTVQGNEALAAKVNGQPIPLALYQRQAAQAQVALVQQGVDPNTKDGQDAIKGLQEQVLGQLIDNSIVEQAAKADNISVTDADVNNRIQQIVNDAGGNDKFQTYLDKNQLTLEDLCIQVRASVIGESMLAHVTADMPTKVEQLHVAHILFSKREDADAALKKLQAGEDFAATAKELSQDEATKDNGGDLGWIPKGVMPAEFEAAAFQLQAGQVSPVVQTQLGFHLIKVLERDPSRELSQDLLQNQRQVAFLAWLDTQRSSAKIEKLISP